MTNSLLADYRRNSGNSMSMTRTSNLDDYEVYAQINESYVVSYTNLYASVREERGNYLF